MNSAKITDVANPTRVLPQAGSGTDSCAPLGGLPPASLAHALARGAARHSRDHPARGLRLPGLEWTLRSSAPPASMTSRYPCLCMRVCVRVCVCVCVCVLHMGICVCAYARECARVNVCAHVYACCSCRGGRPIRACYPACAAAPCMRAFAFPVRRQHHTPLHIQHHTHTHKQAHAVTHMHMHTHAHTNVFAHSLTLFNQVANRPGSFYNTSLDAGEVSAVGGVPFGFTSYDVPGGGHGRLLTILA